VANSTLADNARKHILTTSTPSTGGPSEASAGDGVVTQAVGPVPFGTPAGDGTPVHAPTTAAPAAAAAFNARATDQAPTAPANDANADATHAAAASDTVGAAVRAPYLILADGRQFLEGTWCPPTGGICM
jgi:hypothetical protein